ncbi:MAG: flap endonuclease [Opitutae bacterium]|nr:flap endonuclease [Opitutae bacterium]
MANILLCDGHNLAFRSFYGIRELNRSDGFPTNMVHGWVKSFWKLEDEFNPNQIHVFFDLGGATKREELLPSYKENRGLPPEGFQDQLEWIKKLSEAFGYGVYEKKGLEADDLIASAVRILKEKLLEEVLIVSADKDLAQLVAPKIKQLLPPPTANPRLGWRILDVDRVIEKFGVPPSRILDYLSIIGDQSDNIPGLVGVGPKTATKWLKEYDNLENIIQNAGRISPKRFCSLIYEERELLRRNRSLVELEPNVELKLVSSISPNVDKIKEIFTELEMKQSLMEVDKRY